MGQTVLGFNLEDKILDEGSAAIRSDVTAAFRRQERAGPRGAKNVRHLRKQKLTTSTTKSDVHSENTDSIPKFSLAVEQLRGNSLLFEQLSCVKRSSDLCFPKERKLPVSLLFSCNNITTNLERNELGPAKQQN